MHIEMIMPSLKSKKSPYNSWTSGEGFEQNERGHKSGSFQFAI